MVSIWDTVGMEVFLLVIFGLGYVAFNTGPVQKLLTRPDAQDALLRKQMAADFSSGNNDEVLRRAKLIKALDLDTLCLVLRAMLEVGQQTAVWAYAQAALSAHACLQTCEGASVLLELLPRCALSEAFAWLDAEGLVDATGLSLLVVAWTESMDLDKVKQLLLRGAACPPKTWAVLVKAAMKQDLEEARGLVAQMAQQGVAPPGSLLAQLMRAHSDPSAFLDLLDGLNVSPDQLQALLEACAKDRAPALAEELRRRAASKGVPTPQPGFEALIRMYAKLCDNAKAFALLDELQASGLPCSTQLCVTVAASCAEARNVPLAEHVLKCARVAGTANLTLYSHVVKVYAQTRQFAQTCELYRMLLDDGLEPDTVMYGGLIKAAVECGQLDLSKKLLQRSGTMDIQNYMALFRACGRERNVRKCLDLLQELEESEVGIDTTAYNCVLDVCLRSGDVRQGTALFAKMKTLGFVDTISYNTLLKASRAGPLDAMSLLEDMKQRGLAPNQVTYNSLLNVCVSKGDLAQAWRFVEDMEQSGIAVDNFTCSTMMKGLKYKSSKEDVDKTLGLIERSRVCPDEVLVNTLLDACIRLRDVKRLTTALNTFRLSGAVPSEPSYGTLIRAYGQARCPEQCVQMWRDMRERQVLPSANTLQAMVEACCANGALDAATAALHDQRARPGFQVPLSAYQQVIKACAARKDADKAMQLYADVQQRGALDLATYNSLIDACARSGDCERASQLFRDLCAAGVVPDLVTYSTIIKGYCVGGDLEQAVQLFMLMRKKGVQPDAVLFNAILDGCARKQMTAMSAMMLGDMESSGVKPTSLTLSILVKMYGKAKDLETADELLERLPRQYGIEVNAQVQQSVLTAQLACGEVQKAQRTYAKLRPEPKAAALFVGGCLKHGDVARAVEALQQAVAKGLHVDPELCDNCVFMASRRKLDTKALVQQLQAKGYAVQSPQNSPRGAEQHSQFHARRLQSQQWRDSDSE